MKRVYEEIKSFQRCPSTWPVPTCKYFYIQFAIESISVPLTMDSPVSINKDIDQQVLQETVRFEPCSGIRNILITGGNGFM